MNTPKHNNDTMHPHATRLVDIVEDALTANDNYDVLLTDLEIQLNNAWPSWRVDLQVHQQPFKDVIDSIVVRGFFGYRIETHQNQVIVAREQMPEEYFVDRLLSIYEEKDSLPASQVESALIMDWPGYLAELEAANLKDAIEKHARDIFLFHQRKRTSYVSRRKVTPQPQTAQCEDIENADDVEDEDGQENIPPRALRRRGGGGNGSPPSRLTEENLRRHDRDYREVRQFGCTECSCRTWWKMVPQIKPVSTCKGCGIRYDAIPPEKAHGHGIFDCPCGHRWTNRKSKGKVKQPCRMCGRLVSATSIQPIPKTQGPRRSKARHRCEGCDTGACRFQFEASRRHQSTGSTIATASDVSVGSFDDDTDRNTRFDILGRIFL